MVQKNHIHNFPKKLLLASPRGFCAGVKRAIEALNQAVTEFPDQTIYCYHQIVHNTHVVKEFQDKGVIFVDKLEDVPRKSILIFSSHGVSPHIKQQALKQQLITIDATCPYVLKTHLEVKRYAGENYQIIYIGQPKHDEAMGTTGEAPGKTIIIQNEEEAANIQVKDPKKVALVTQTTLSFDETDKITQILKTRFPEIKEPVKSDICTATQNRQNGVKEVMKRRAELVIVLGSPNSSNSNKLRVVAEKAGAKAYLLDDIIELDPTILQEMNCVGLTAGASLPEYKISEAIDWFKNHGFTEIEEVSVAKEEPDSLPAINLSLQQ